MQDRFARQRLVIGPEGQAKLQAAKILVVGLGGLGCPAATQLALASVGTLGLCDFDTIEESNLHRQPLYTVQDIGAAKLDVAMTRLQAMAPAATFYKHPLRVATGNARDLATGYDLVLDCTDSLEARYALSDACAGLGLPLLQAGLGALDGELAQLCGTGPCYRCLHPESIPGATCATEGTLGPLAATIGSLQALWAMQIILAWPEAVPGRVLLFDGRSGETQAISLMRRPGCNAHMEKLGPSNPTDGPACPMPWNAPEVTEIAVDEFALHAAEFFVLDVREPDENEEYALPGSTLIPLGQLQHRVTELPKDRNILVYCAVGGRSAHATHFLRHHGYKAVNLRGGMRAWFMSGRGT